MQPKIIAIAGPSGSGKSLLTRRLRAALLQDTSLAERCSSVAVVQEDAYYHSQAHLTLDERAALNFDHPDALDHALLERDLLSLKTRQAVNIPIYDYASHTRAQRSESLKPADVILVEGCLFSVSHAFAPPSILACLSMQISTSAFKGESCAILKNAGEPKNLCIHSSNLQSDPCIMPSSRHPWRTRI